MGRGGPRRAQASSTSRRSTPFNGGEISPGPSVETDEEILDWVARDAETALHPSCTCRMGIDDMSVVDPQTMRVHGVDGLRVVDASVDALRHQRQHLRAGDDGRREGRRPDPRQHAAACVAGRFYRHKGQRMLNELQVGEFLAALGERTPSPASGAATALTGALAAGLAELAARFAGDEEAIMKAKAAVGAPRPARRRGLRGLRRVHGRPQRRDPRADRRRPGGDRRPRRRGRRDRRGGARPALARAWPGTPRPPIELARAAARVARRLADLNR